MDFATKDHRMFLPHFLQKHAARILALVCAALAIAGVHAEKIKNLKPQGYVNDFAGVLSGPAKEKLTELCGEVDRKAGAQIAVVTVHSLEGETAEQYTFDLASQWGVGPKQSSRGVMILIAPDEHKYYTAVGYGLEPILPDGKVGGFGREAVPLLRQNDYDSAILLMTQRVAAVIAADKGITLTNLNGASPLPSQPDSNSGDLILGMPPPLFALSLFLFITVVVIPLLRLFFWRTFGMWGGPPHKYGGPTWWIGGPWGSSWGGGGFGGRGGGFGGGGGGGGFGGFGGGSFGGGGAGGSW